jgi:formylmethanofuran dehydrogenase subunit E
MRVKTPKRRDWSDDIRDRGIEFHGHGGPFMVLGIRMGLVALERLDAHGWFDLRCLAKLRWAPPDSCVLDGIQISSGCTMGKHNVYVEEQDGIAAEFAKGERVLEIRLRQEILDRIRGVLASKDADCAKSLISELIEAPEAEIFIVSLT